MRNISGWVISCTIFTLVIGLIYGAVQQNYRQGANDPQIQLAEDAVIELLSLKQPAEVVGRAPLFDVEKSLAPFVAIYDNNGNPMESTAYLGNNPPKPPFGVFEYAKAYGENRVTWQPNSSTRIALVVVPVNNKSGLFVASGRNLREVERREGSLSGVILMVWGLVIFLLSFQYFILKKS